jgi:hypothetical protein
MMGSVTTVPPPLVPRYGERTLAEVLPSLLAAIGVTGFANPLGIAPASIAGLLLVDGLGWDLLHAYAADAPFLAALAVGSAPVFAGFPATTAVSLATLGTGRPPGEHGIVGYTFAVPGADLLNALTWRSHGDRSRWTCGNVFRPSRCSRSARWLSARPGRAAP